MFCPSHFGVYWALTGHYRWCIVITEQGEQRSGARETEQMAQHDLAGMFTDARGKGTSRYFAWRSDTLGNVAEGDTIRFTVGAYRVTKIGDPYRDKSGNLVAELSLVAEHA